MAYMSKSVLPSTMLTVDHIDINKDIDADIDIDVDAGMGSWISIHIYINTHVQLEPKGCHCQSNDSGTLPHRSSSLYGAIRKYHMNPSPKPMVSPNDIEPT